MMAIEKVTLPILAVQDELACPWLSDSEVNQQLKGLSSFTPSYALHLTSISSSALMDEV